MGNLGILGLFRLKFRNFRFLGGEFCPFGAKLGGIPLFLIAKFRCFRSTTSHPQPMTSSPPEISPNFEFFLGPNPQVAKGTHVLIPLGGSSPTGWTAELDEGVAEPVWGVAGSDHTLWLGLEAPPSAPIGRYRVSVRTRAPGGEFAAPFEADNDVVVLFNPWCPGGFFGERNGDFGTKKKGGKK